MPTACRLRARSALRAGARRPSPRPGGGSRGSREQRADVARRQEAGAVTVAAPARAAEHDRPESERGEQQATRPLGLPQPAVLGEEAEDAAQVLDVQPPAVRRAPDVDDLRIGDERDLPAGVMEAIGPVGFLAEHEEVLVEEPDGVSGLAANEQ